MAATDHLSAVLFHGTAHPFLEGDVVNPTDASWGDEPMAFATAELEHAAAIARVKAEVHNRRNPDDPREPRVFEVEHMSEPADIWGLRGAADPVGFRVKSSVDVPPKPPKKPWERR